MSSRNDGFEKALRTYYAKRKADFWPKPGPDAVQEVERVELEIEATSEGSCSCDSYASASLELTVYFKRTPENPYTYSYATIDGGDVEDFINELFELRDSQ